MEDYFVPNLRILTFVRYLQFILFKKKEKFYVKKKYRN